MIKNISTSRNNQPYKVEILKSRERVYSKAILWLINHTTLPSRLSLKVGKYTTKNFVWKEELYNESPKSELTLDEDETEALIKFLDLYKEPLLNGVKKFISLDDSFSDGELDHLKAIFESDEKIKLVNLILENNLIPEDILGGIRLSKMKKALLTFEDLLKNNVVESEWQDFFKMNTWILGTSFIKILDNRQIDEKNIADYLVKAMDGFIDIIELKRPSCDIWRSSKNHDNYIKSTELVEAEMQIDKYMQTLEKESNSLDTFEKLENCKIIKPRATLICGRSDLWNKQQFEDFRIINSSYNNKLILTFDMVLDRAKRIIDIYK
jgi:hypothetical protein